MNSPESGEHDTVMPDAPEEAPATPAPLPTPHNPFATVVKKVKTDRVKIKFKPRLRKPLLPSDQIERRKIDVDKLDLDKSYVELVRPVNTFNRCRSKFQATSLK